MKKRGFEGLFCKLFALLLVSAILFSGCGKQEAEENYLDSSRQDSVGDGNNVQGGVQIVEPEEKVQYAASYSDMGIPLGCYGFQMVGNTLYAEISDYSAGENHYYKEIIGNDAPAEELMISSAIYGEIIKYSLGFCVNADGYLYFILLEGENVGQERYYLVKCASDGRELSRLEITEQIAAAYEEGEIFLNVVTDSQDRIYIATNYHIYLYDEEETYFGELTEPAGIVSIGKSREGVIYYTKRSENPAQGSGQQLVKVDFESKSSAETYQGFPEGILTGNLTAGIRFDFMVNDGENLYGYNIESRTAERILKWSESDITGRNIAYIKEMENGAILAVVSGSSIRLAYLEKWDESMVVPEREVITVGMMYYQSENFTRLKDAIARYNEGQDRYRVEIKEYGSAESLSVSNLGGESRDGMDALTLELAVGKGPDLIFKNTYFPIYAKRGLLEDLNDYLEGSEILSKEDYLESTLKMFTFDNKLVALPSFETLYTCYGYTDQIGEAAGCSLEDLLKLQEETTEIPLFYVGRADCAQMALFELSEYVYSFIDWENGTCDFESDEFRTFLEYCNTAPAIEDCDDDPWTPMHIGEDYLIEFSTISSDTGFLKIKLAAEQRDITMIGYPVKEGTGNYLVDYFQEYSLGLSSRSKHKEAAWEFLEYLHGTILEEMYVNIMAGRDSGSFPAKKSFLEQSVYNDVGETYAINGMEYVMTVEDAGLIMDLLENASPLNTVLYSSIVYDIIQEEAGAYFAGDKNVDEVMEIIQRRVQLYLSENY